MSYNFYYWGPLVFKTKISEKDKNKLLKLKVLKRVNQELVGVIEDEFSLNVKKCHAIIEKYLPLFYECYQHWYVEPLDKKMKINKAWINFMRPGDFNPIHTHVECSFSSVVFLKIGKKLKEENKRYANLFKEGSASRGPGCINFVFGNPAPFAISEASFFPEEGDLYIFPYNVRHFVQPFKMKTERISAAFNFVLK